jgi:hypothetical protein
MAMARSRRLFIETLEDRLVPAIFGTPWADSLHLTLSFAPDGTSIAGQQSSLFQSLNAIEPAAVWQREILRAVQTWASKANINVGVVSDGGEPFGVSGPTQGDPRFGDIRIGAEPMRGVLAESVPPAPYLSGTWAGDILLNSSYPFDGANTDLYSVMLHEVGHVLGLPDSTDSNSVMYYDATTPRSSLSLSDIATVQALYGIRAPDVSNGTFATATHMPFPPTQDDSMPGSLPLVAYGDINRGADTDVYSVQTPSQYQGSVTFHLLTSGASLLEPRLIVYNANGSVLGSASSTNISGDVISVQIPNVSPNTSFYIRVQTAGSAPFNIGRYGLGVIFDGRTTVTTAALDTVLRGPYESLSQANIDALLRNPNALFSDDGGSNSSLATAKVLPTSPGYRVDSHYQVLGSLTDAEDFSYYKVTSPGTGTGTDLLTVTVDGIGPNGDAPSVSVFDAAANPVASTVLVNGNGTFTIQAANLKRGVTYYLRLASDSSSGQGNFTLTADFNQQTKLLSSYSQGQLTTSAPQQTNSLFIAKNQIFQFALSASMPPDSETSVEMTILDQNNNVVFDTTANGSGPSSGTVILAAGAYRVVFKIVNGGDLAGALAYQLFGTVLSDPIGPTPSNPTLQPLYTNPGNPGQYTYPNGTVSTNPFLWLGYAL